MTTMVAVVATDKSFESVEMEGSRNLYLAGGTAVLFGRLRYKSSFGRI